MPPGAWIDAATTARGETLTVEVAGVDAKGPTPAAWRSPTRCRSRSRPRTCAAACYYWSTAVTGTGRLLFGAHATDAYITHSSTTTPTCGGCHAVSRDGSTIAFEQGDTGKGVLWVAPTAKPDTPLFPLSAMHDAGTQALNHDGTRVLVSFSGRLLLRDAEDGHHDQRGRRDAARAHDARLSSRRGRPTISASPSPCRRTVTPTGRCAPARSACCRTTTASSAHVDIIVPTGTTPRAATSTSTRPGRPTDTSSRSPPEGRRRGSGAGPDELRPDRRRGCASSTSTRRWSSSSRPRAARRAAPRPGPSSRRSRRRAASCS